MWRLLVGGVVLLFLSCSFKYEDWGVKNPNQIPQTVMTDFVEKNIKNGKVQYEFQGQKIETYDALKEWRLKDVTFQQYDDSGKLLSKGSVADALIHTDTHDAVMKGQVNLWSASQATSVSTSDVSWTQNLKILQVAPDATVVLKKDDGSTLSGLGLVLDFRDNELKLQGPIVGLWKTDTKNETNPAISPAPTPTPLDTPGPVPSPSPPKR
ncbi:MAG: LPS export ABC transporter periplasmic protein LptC [Spirochaetales bacterium]|nr:LPS export ABC transporter periplasmic protein LptC [Spirochaetales bacterium]